ncbi:MAG: hypothetical protein JST47_00240 [Bacteroidetes bacterium]|nr:hypothetical protein [Bacteroidota bacterium]
MRSVLYSLLAALTILLVFNTKIFAQKKQFNEGTTTPVRVGSVTLNLGAGIGANYREDDYYSPFGLKAALEFGLWQAGPGVITLGPELGASFASDGYYHNYNSYHSRTLIMAARSAWHYGWKVRGLDTYGGLSLGFGIHHYDYYDGDSRHNSYNEVIPVLGAFVGASYFVSPKFGFNAEAGYDITNFQLGVIFKLK